MTATPRVGVAGAAMAGAMPSAGTPSAAIPSAASSNDPLGDVLRLVHVASALFLHAEFSAPWGCMSPPQADLVQVLQPGARQLVLFHVVAEGQCQIALPGGDVAIAQAGEVVLLPYADQHSMADPADAALVPIVTLLPPLPWTAMARLRHGGGGSPTRLLCGYFRCDELLFNPFLKALPPLVHLRPEGPAAEWLQASLRYALDELGRDAPGATLLLDRLPEVLLVDCLRQYARRLSSQQTGWLAALNDAVVGRALTLLHAQPALPWDVEKLARHAGTSRSVLGARFGELLGESPMRYLAHWRLQLAAHALATGETPVSVVATRVGYESEAAFSRAFKRRLGVSPLSWRNAERGVNQAAAR